MAAELKSINPAINVEILGVNQAGQEPSNSLVTGATSLPWLQDGGIPTAANRWQISLRDVRILTPQNHLFAVYNLTSSDLSDPGNYAALKQLFLNAAQFTDTDGDGLQDDWEMLWLGSLSHNGQADPDGDGESNATEFAFGTNPNDSSSKSSFVLTFSGSGAQRLLNVEFKRRAGTRFSYSVDGSTALTGWTTTGVAITQSFQNLFDGSGTGRMRMTFPAPAGTAQSFVRVQAVQP